MAEAKSGVDTAEAKSVGSGGDNAQFVRVPFHLKREGKWIKGYIPGKFREEDKMRMRGWVSCAKQNSLPGQCEVDQLVRNQVCVYTFDVFKDWFYKRFGHEPFDHEPFDHGLDDDTTKRYVPDVWIQGDHGWIMQFGPKVETIAFGGTTVQVSQVKEGHGIFFAGNIPEGSYENFTVFGRRPPSW